MTVYVNIGVCPYCIGTWVRTGSARPCSAGGAYRTSGTATIVTDAERLSDIAEKLFRWRYLSSYPDAEHDVAWLLEKLGERNVRIAELEARLRRNEWIYLLP